MGGCCVTNCCIGDSIKNFFSNIFGSGSGGGCGYHPGPSETEEHAKKIADELAEMVENMSKISEEKERNYYTSVPE